MPDITLLAQMLAMLLAIGALAGVLAGLLGIGGGLILVPAFFYAFRTLGYDGPQLMQICLATSLATIIVSSARAMLSHHRKGAVDWAILRGWTPAIAAGALLGVGVAAGLRSDTLQAIFGGLGVVIALYFGFGRAQWRLGDVMPSGIWRLLTAPAIGFLSVLVGIGGGSFGVALMTLHGISIHRAVATSAGFGLAIAVSSVLGFLMVEVAPETRPPLTIGAVNLVAFATVSAMTMITAPLGVRLAHAMNPGPLRRVFAIFVAIVVLNMLRKALGW
ncbi:sulfite exporter TauE/SafE family protein [Roseovarius autotrophicus]|uniref:sulfite exporter TauE/SafE family protein n=1 Tax=Roseovarius autotrophicus TaxID=2824121 RepID=UPI0019FF3F94|nr:sulfite exporter TauE/SafE family protein [Roseovarius autotrophicus]MBE0453851.1 sulfite exporter TauE/SafE family protein [Roseovarius sp.]